MEIILLCLLMGDSSHNFAKCLCLVCNTKCLVIGVHGCNN
jgi:hypothetical protein